MKQCEKGTFEYLKHKKKNNLIYTIIAFAIVFIIFFAGLLIFKTRNNYCTLVATVLVLPAAKIAVGYFVLLPHKSASKELYDQVVHATGALTCCFDCVFSNSKKPIGTQAVVITDNCICALTNEEHADTTLFENSVKDFLKNDKLNVTVTLYKEEKPFFNRIKNLTANFDINNKNSSDRMKWNTDAVKNMCL